MKKIEAGYYELENGFQIVKSDGVWVVIHADIWKLNQYLSEGYDQLFSSLSDAHQYVIGIEL